VPAEILKEPAVAQAVGLVVVVAPAQHQQSQQRDRAHGDKEQNEDEERADLLVLVAVAPLRFVWPSQACRVDTRLVEVARAAPWKSGSLARVRV